MKIKNFFKKTFYFISDGEDIIIDDGVEIITKTIENKSDIVFADMNVTNKLFETKDVLSVFNLYQSLIMYNQKREVKIYDRS